MLEESKWLESKVIKLSHLTSSTKDTQITMLIIVKDIVSNVYIAKTTSFALFTAPADYYLLPARHRSRTVLV